MKPIYLDHNATTPTRPEVIEALARCYAQDYANPASRHQPGQQARRVLEDARERIAALLGADLNSPQPDHLIFTAGGTEANNLAVLGIASASERPGLYMAERTEPSPAERAGPSPAPAPALPPQIIISAVEHPSVIEPAERLLDLGWRLDTLGVDANGVLRIAELPRLLTPQTRLVSLILGNHETGVMQPVGEAVQFCQSLKIPIHTDAVQVVGKRPVNFRQLGVSALSLAAHKFGGPTGIGALILRHDLPLTPLCCGGHQQYGLRPGTESIPLAVGMMTALEIACREQADSTRRLESLRRRFEEDLLQNCPQILIHGRFADRLPQTSNIAFPGVDGQVLLIALDVAGVACSVGAACASGSSELSPTLRAMQLPGDIVRSSLRFSLGTTNTEAEIDQAVAIISRIYRSLAPPSSIFPRL
jgi:cysteine desulfurase